MILKRIDVSQEDATVRLKLETLEAGIYYVLRSPVEAFRRFHTIEDRLDAFDPARRFFYEALAWDALLCQNDAVKAREVRFDMNDDGTPKYLNVCLDSMRQRHMKSKRRLLFTAYCLD